MGTNMGLKYIIAILMTGHIAQAICEETNEYAKKIGWIHGNCLAIENSELKPQDRITIISFKDKPPSASEILARTNDGKSCPALLDDRKRENDKGTLSFYIITPTETPPELTIGVMSNVDITALHFDYCNTSEGIVFTAKKAQPSGQTVVWRSYYYLGYDMESNCNIRNK